MDHCSYDVVLANGTVLANVTRDSNPDLFWGLNGAAPNFGIVTSYQIQAHHAPTTAVIFSYSYDSPSTTIAATAFHSYEQFANLSAPANLGLSATFGRDSLEISGVWYGPEAEFDGVIQSLTDELPPSFTSSVKAYSWIDSAKQLAGGQSLDTMDKQLLSRVCLFFPYTSSFLAPALFVFLVIFPLDLSL